MCLRHMPRSSNKRQSSSTFTFPLALIWTYVTDCWCRFKPYYLSDYCYFLAFFCEYDRNFFFFHNKHFKNKLFFSCCYPLSDFHCRFVLLILPSLFWFWPKISLAKIPDPPKDAYLYKCSESLYFILTVVPSDHTIICLLFTVIVISLAFIETLKSMEKVDLFASYKSLKTLVWILHWNPSFIMNVLTHSL